MKHQALCSALAVFLTVLCIIQLVVGVFGLSKADEAYADALEAAERVQNRINNYIEYKKLLDETTLDYDALTEELNAKLEEHSSDASDHKTDLAMYTATRSGELQGADALWAAKAGIEEGRRQLETAEAEYKIQAEEFYKQYDQFMKLKPILEAAAPLINFVISSSGSARDALVSVLNNAELSEEQYQAANFAFQQLRTAIDSFRASEYYSVLYAQAAGYGVDIEQIFSRIASYADENGNLIRTEDGKIPDYIANSILNDFDQAMNTLIMLNSALENEEQLIAGKEMIDQAGAKIEEGKKQLDEAEWMIQSSLEILWYELGKLDKQKEEFEASKEELLTEAEEMDGMQEELDAYDALTKRVKGAKNLLLAYDDINTAVDGGAELTEASQSYHDGILTKAEHEREYRKLACKVAIAAAIVGFTAMLGAFEVIKIRYFTAFTALICCGVSIASEYIYHSLDIGSVYITIITPIFALILAVAALPQKKINV